MADNQALIELLEFYKEQKTIKRPEVGILTGKTVGQIAGVCHKNGIRPWPDVPDKVIAERGCQFPIIKNGLRHICGKMHSSNTADTLRCDEHQGKVWNPDKETSSVVIADNSALVELLRFYRDKAKVTLQDVSVLTVITLEQIEELCQRHTIEAWPAIPREIIRDRPCQFPILKHGERYVCGLFRSAGADADPLCCSDHRGLMWDPNKEL